MPGAAASGQGRRRIGLAIGAGLFVLMLALPPPEGLELAPWRVAAVAVLMASLWLTEAVPISVTALLPLVLFPLLGVAPIGAASAPYADPLVFLFLGGFLIGLAIERWNLHRRIALNVLVRVGAREDLQVGGFMLATAVLSMWVSNTATALMMLPVALSVVPRGTDGAVAPGRERFAVALLLSVAYAASIGGLATLVGTPPNAFLRGYMSQNFGIEIGFAEWMLIGVPVSVVMLAGAWWLLTGPLFRLGREEVPGARDAIRRSLAQLGAASPAEKRVAAVFMLTAGLWITRPLLDELVPGLSDTTIAVAGALLLFVVPSGVERGRFLLTWDEAERLPWGVLLLFGGGLSLAGAVSDTGLAAWLGEELEALAGWPVFLLVLTVSVLVIFLTELTSNLGTTATFLPVVTALAVGIGQPPLLLAVPAVIAASCAFMLPVATPPNAIVFASGLLTVPQMARTGFWLNVLGVVVTVALVYLLIGPVFGV
ncbi:MAG: SLC13 family permease [Gammaproteobacteria bacterium]|nr:anion transporter [Gammaproteobacteria bacterium]